MRGSLIAIVAIAMSIAAPAVVAQSSASGPDTLRLVEQLRIGALNGDERYLFGHVGALASTSDGSVFVFDQIARSIRLYDADGAFVRTVATAGEGPGEIENVAGLGTTPGGQVAVWDPANQRLSLFHPSGDFITSHRVVADGSPGGFVVGAAGEFYVKSMIRSSRQRPYDWQWEWITIGPYGAVLDTLAVPRREPEPHPAAGVSSPDGLRWSFPESTEHAVTPGGHIVSGRNTAYELTRDAGEGPRPFYSRQVERLPITRAERDFWEDVRRRTNARSEVEFPAVPRTKPTFRRLFSDSDGRIWVERYVEAEHVPQDRDSESPRVPYEWREPTTFDVILPSARLLGTVTMPPNSVPLAISGDVVWGTARGEFDEHYVVKWRLSGRR